MKKRILSLLLALVLAMGSLPAALAEETVPPEPEGPSEETLREIPPASVPSLVGTDGLNSDLPAENAMPPADGTGMDSDPQGTPAEDGLLETENVPPVTDGALPDVAGLAAANEMPLDTGGADPLPTGRALVDISAQSAEEFLLAPQLAAEVDAGLAESYGLPDSVADGVSLMDVLVEAHVRKYGEAFTKETAGTYLAADASGVTKLFGADAAGFGCALTTYVMNKQNAGEHASGRLVALTDLGTTAVTDWAEVSFLSYRDAKTDTYAYITANSNLQHNKLFYILLGYDADFLVAGYPAARNVGVPDADAVLKRAQTGFRFCYINEDGSLTDIPDGLVNANGRAEFQMERTGDYLLAARAVRGDAPLSWARVRVAEPIQVDDVKIYATAEDYQAGKEPFVLTNTEDPSKGYVPGQLTGYAVTVPDYLSMVCAVIKVGDQVLSDSMRDTISVSEAERDKGLHYWAYGRSQGAGQGGGYARATWADNGGKISFWFSGYYPCTTGEFSGGRLLVLHAFNSVAAHEIEVKQFATLKGLAVDGVYDWTFDRSVLAYTAQVDSAMDGVDITVTPYSNGYTVTVGGQKAVGGKVRLPYSWSGDTMEVPIVVSGGSFQAATYTLILTKLPQGDTPAIYRQPVGAGYLEGDKAEPLSVGATANGTMTYQWYRNTAESAEGAQPIDGASGAAYTPDTTAAGAGTFYYFCRITNTGAAGTPTVVSDIVKVTVAPDPGARVSITNDVPEITGYQEPKGLVYAVGASGDSLTAKAEFTADSSELEKVNLTWYYAYSREEYEARRNRRYGTTQYDSAAMTAAYSIATISRKPLADGYYFYAQLTYTVKATGKSYELYSDPVWVYFTVTEAETPAFNRSEHGFVDDDHTIAQYSSSWTTLYFVMQSPSYGTLTGRYYRGVLDEETYPGVGYPVDKDGYPTGGELVADNVSFNTSSKRITYTIDSSIAGEFYYYATVTNTYVDHGGKSYEKTIRVPGAAIRRITAAPGLGSERQLPRQRHRGSPL